MRTDEQLDQTISKWLEREAPAQLPDRVLGATFERTRRSRQQPAWRALLGNVQLNRFVSALAGAAAVVVLTVVGFGLYVNQPGFGGPMSTSSPEPSLIAEQTPPGLNDTARPSSTSSPPPAASSTPTPIAWNSQSAAEDWPAPPRSELPGAPLETGAAVAPGWVQYADITADTAPADVAAVDIGTIQVGRGCVDGQPQLTCIELTLLGHVDEPRPLPEDEWFGFGIVVDIDADGEPDQRYGIDNSGRAWRADLKTGDIVTVAEFYDELYAEFPPGAEASGGDTPEAIFHLRESGFRFYGWSSLITDGAIQATDYAPNVGWLEVPDARFAGSWQSTDPPRDNSGLTMEIVPQPNDRFAVTILDEAAAVCGGSSSTMTGIAELQEPNSIVIKQPDYTCDDGSEAEALSGPPLDEQLRNFTLTSDSQRDELEDASGLIWTRLEVAQ